MLLPLRVSQHQSPELNLLYRAASAPPLSSPVCVIRSCELLRGAALGKGTFSE